MIDGRLSRFWIFNSAEGGIRDGDVIFAFPEWAQNPYDFYDKLSDGEQQEVQTLERYRGLMENEFASPDLSAEATRLDADWVQCPECAEAWEAPLWAEAVTCPKCGTVWRRPGTVAP